MNCELIALSPYIIETTNHYFIIPITTIVLKKIYTLYVYLLAVGKSLNCFFR